MYFSPLSISLEEGTQSLLVPDEEPRLSFAEKLLTTTTGSLWSKMKKERRSVALLVLLIVSSLVMTTSHWRTMQPSIREQVLSVLVKDSSVLNQAALEDASSPQARALEWLLSVEQGRAHEFLHTALHLRLVQRYTLAVLYYTTNGQHWNMVHGNWLTSAGECQWTSLDCINEQIANLDLHSHNLTGTIPTELTALSNLERLRLERNHLSGTIPTEIGRFSNLQSLNLGENHLSGTIPTQLFEGRSASSMRELWLNGNHLSGSVPTQVGRLTSLVDLGLHDGNLSGTIPTQVGQLTNLKLLLLEENHFSGPIPSELGYLISASLRTLHLEHNHLSGMVAPMEEEGNKLCGSLSQVSYDCGKVSCCCGDGICAPVGFCRDTPENDSCDSFRSR